jgi:hypothetical protein
MNACTAAKPAANSALALAFSAFSFSLSLEGVEVAGEAAAVLWLLLLL